MILSSGLMANSSNAPCHKILDPIIEMNLILLLTIQIFRV